MTVPFVEVNNLNQMQGEPTEIERHFLFIGSGTTNAGKLLSINAQTDFDKVLGAPDTPLKLNLMAARDNAGQNWTAGAFVLPTDMEWADAVRTAQASQSFEAVVVLEQTWDEASINAAEALNKELLATFHRWCVMLLAVPAIRLKDDPKDETLKAQGWADYETELAALQEGIAAPSVGLVPMLWPNLMGVYAGRLCNRAVSIADSPCRVKTGALVGLGNMPVDMDEQPLPRATLVTLSTNRFSVPLWYPDYDGIYWSDGMQLDAEGGDYQVIENLRVAYKVSRRMRLIAIPRLGDRSFNSTPTSTAANIVYLGKPLREMSRITTIGGQPFPGDISPPRDGDITITWTSKTRVSIYVVVRTVDCPKGITINIILDTSLNSEESA